MITDEEMMNAMRLMEQVLFSSIQYAKLANTKYAKYVDADKYTEYLHTLYSVESMWFNASDLTNRDQDYGKANIYEGRNAQGQVRSFAQWMKMESGEISTNGIANFVKTLDKLGNVVSGWLRNLKIKWKLRRVNPQYISEVFNDLKANIDRRAQHAKSGEPKLLQVNAPDMQLMSTRLKGYVAICDLIHKFAEDTNAEAFDSDKTWDEFASQSNNALKTRPPKSGMFFRELVRVEPYTHTFDCTKSEWADESALQNLEKEICEVKETLFTKIQDDMKFIKKITDGLQSEVSHTKLKGGNIGKSVADDNIKEKTVGPYTVAKGSTEEVDEMVVKYARSYVASKFVLQLQDMFASEVLYILKDIPRMFALGKTKDIEDTAKEVKQKFTK